MRLADAFTTSRIVLAPVFCALFFFPEVTGVGMALSVYLLVPLFIFMEFTDYLDGYYARKHAMVSDFGKLFDPFADVLANLTVLFTFVVSGYMPAPLFLIIMYREMGIMFVRMLASGQGVVIAARKGGKTKTVLYIVAAGCSLLLVSFARLELSIPVVERWGRTINLGLYILATIVSVASFIDYLVAFSSVLRNHSRKS
jgi:CDP-diacylglycerol--glycerol-3-phosphate 3-phosphatidyltransferase